MRSREVGIVVTQLTMLIAAWDPSRCQHRLGSRTQLTVTARNPPIVDAASRAGNRCYRLPSGTFTKGANFHWGLDHLMNPHFTKTRHTTLASRGERNTPASTQPASTLHPEAVSMQVGTAVELCTSCEGCGPSVESGGKPRKAAPKGPFRASGLQNRLPARIFTVDIPRRGSKIRAVRFSQLSPSQIPSRYKLGMNETCEEKL